MGRAALLALCALVLSGCGPRCAEDTGDGICVDGNAAADKLEQESEADAQRAAGDI